MDSMRLRKLPHQRLQLLYYRATAQEETQEEQSLGLKSQEGSLKVETQEETREETQGETQEETQGVESPTQLLLLPTRG